jgi:hypothetical protein
MQGFAVQVALRGLTDRQVEEDLPLIAQYLMSRDYLRAVQVEWDAKSRQAILSLELEWLDAERAALWADDEFSKAVDIYAVDPDDPGELSFEVLDVHAMQAPQ